MKYKGHPEVQKDIQAEYTRLDDKRPDLSVEFKLKLATEYVRQCQAADTAVMLHEYLGGE